MSIGFQEPEGKEHVKEPGKVKELRQVAFASSFAFITDGTCKGHPSLLDFTKQGVLSLETPQAALSTYSRPVVLRVSIGETP